MTNTVKTNIPGLLIQSGQCAAGAVQYGDAIRLKQNPAPDIQTDIDGVVDEGVAYDQANVQLTNFRKTRVDTIESAREMLSAACELFKPTLGRVWSEKWLPTGFTNGLRIPRTYGGIQARVHSVAKFLQNNAALERPDSNITAVKVMALFTALNTAQTNINTQRTHVQNMYAGRNAKVKQLRLRVRGVINELGQLIDPLDNRWVAFGLNKPGAEATPDVPSNVTVVLVGPTAASVNWGASARATYYRVWMRVVGSPDWVSLGNPADLDFTMEQLARNSQIQVAVSAVNSGGESQKSEPVTITTPA